MATKKELKLRTLVVDILKDCGCSTSSLGFEYTIDAALIVYKAGHKRISICNDIYKVIADKNNVKPSSVERNIRGMVGNMIESGDLDYIQGIFGAVASRNTGSIVNRDFIYGVKYEMEKRLLEEE